MGIGYICVSAGIGSGYFFYYHLMDGVMFRLWCSQFYNSLSFCFGDNEMHYHVQFGQITCPIFIKASAFDQSLLVLVFLIPLLPPPHPPLRLLPLFLLHFRNTHQVDIPRNAPLRA